MFRHFEVRINIRTERNALIKLGEKRGTVCHTPRNLIGIFGILDKPCASMFLRAVYNIPKVLLVCGGTRSNMFEVGCSVQPECVVEEGSGPEVPGAVSGNEFVAEDTRDPSSKVCVFLSFLLVASIAQSSVGFISFLR